MIQTKVKTVGFLNILGNLVTKPLFQKTMMLKQNFPGGTTVIHLNKVDLLIPNNSEYITVYVNTKDIRKNVNSVKLV